MACPARGERLRLIDLEPRFVRFAPGGSLRYVDAMPESQGLLLLCPGCFVQNDGPIGTHRILVWFADRGVPPEAQPAPRWRVSGSGFHDLTTSPSIHIQVGCRWHGFLTNGEATSC